MNETVTVRFTWGATTSDVASREGNWDLIFDSANWPLFWTSFAVTTTPNWLTTRLGFVCSVLSNAGFIMRSSDCSCPTCKRFCRLFLCSLGNILYTELVAVDEFAQFQCLMVTLLPPYIMSSRAFAQGENRREKNPSLSMCQSGHLQIVDEAIMDEAGEGFWQKYLYQEILYQPLNQKLYLGPAKSPQEKITSQN